MTLIPAYGRDYKSKPEVLADFDAGKDFQCADIMSGSGYVNKSQLPPGSVVNIRYRKLRSVMVVRVGTIDTPSKAV